MGINGPDEKRIKFGGVNFNPEQVSDYGKSEEGLYYINFKDGTKVKYAQQRRGASIYGDRIGNYNDYNFRDFDTIFVEGSKDRDNYNFTSCKGGLIKTHSDGSRDTINIDNDCSNISVSKDKYDDLYNNGHGTFIND